MADARRTVRLPSLSAQPYRRVSSAFPRSKMGIRIEESKGDRLTFEADLTKMGYANAFKQMKRRT